MSELSDRDERLYEMALADVKKAERMLPVMDEALEIIAGKQEALWKCPSCRWKGDEPSWQEVWNKPSIPFCPKCGREIYP